MPRILTVPRDTEREPVQTWFSDALAKLLEESGIRRGALARKIGYNPRIIGRWLKEGVIPPNRTIRAIETVVRFPGYFDAYRPQDDIEESDDT